MELVKKIEAVLFYLAEPVSINFLAKILEVSKKEIEESLIQLRGILANRGLTVLTYNDEISLTTAPELGSLIEKIIKEEREKDLGKAGIETLTIVAYKGPVTKKEIEYIRGVNSQYAIRSLLLRGLIERVSTGDLRSVSYRITSDTIRFLGLNSIEELPEYSETIKDLNIEERMKEEENLIEENKE